MRLHRDQGQGYLPTQTMADTKTANISKLVIKQAGRAKEKVTILSVHETRAPVILSDILHTRPRERDLGRVAT